ncbi:MAG: hypothetical protein KKD39_08340 [Candidatus Altiarchaeota archaeon]|nr:hypothetical protein [Candidatus Altiarchaeota archaeon]
MESKEDYHIEEYKMDDADFVLVAMGSVCGTIKAVIDEMRKEGVKVGLLKLITFRPFPAKLLVEKLKDFGTVAIVEKALSPGLGGPLYHEISSALYEADKHPKLRSFIVGLGGKDVKLEHVRKIIKLTGDGSGNKVEWMF